MYTEVLSTMLYEFYKTNRCVADTTSATYLQQVSAT
ncbi:hypothetical protein M080_6307, partial [Bacteroides fragilis str. 3397 T10]